MNKTIQYGRTGLITAGVALAGNLAAADKAADKYAAAEKPNIVLILVDDLGFSDVGPYGAADIKTPNLDRLAAEGVRFQQFYNNSISAPTRASLITGQYAHKAGIGYFNVNLGLPAYQGFLNKESLTFGEVLHDAGYTTIQAGKWHVGDDKDQWPKQRGFDQSFGFIGGASNYYNIPGADPAVSNPTSINGVNLIKNNQPYPLAEGHYLTQEITDNALQFLDEQNKEKKPFFLYLAYNAPHWPLQALPEDIAKYKGKFALGWDSLRVERYRNAKRLGVVPGDQNFAERDSTVPEWAKLTYDEQQFWQRRQEVYAAMIDRVDQEVGRVLDKLKALGKDKNTLIVFISDNGAQGGNGSRVLYSAQNQGPVGSAGSYERQNSNWSQTGNSPFRSYKGTPYEGGISAPFIAWYPGKIGAGGIVKGVGHLIDLAPTFYELAGAKYPTTYQGHTTNQLPGKSLLPVLTGKATEVDRKEPLFWERGGNRAVREGNWKLVSTYPENKFRLFDIEKDRAEITDLAAKYPQVVQDLTAKYNAWAAKNEVVDYALLRKKAQPVSNQQVRREF